MIWVLIIFYAVALAREQIDEAGPLMEETKVRARLRETTEARKMMEAYGQPPLVSLEGVKEWMKTAEIGGCLTPDQLEGVERALAAVSRMKQYLNRGKAAGISMAWYTAGCPHSAALRNDINMVETLEGLIELVDKRLR